MIQRYDWPMPHDHEMGLFLEEAGRPCKIAGVAMSKGGPFKTELLAISPGMPVVIDQALADGGEAICAFESGPYHRTWRKKPEVFFPPTAANVCIARYGRSGKRAV